MAGIVSFVGFLIFTFGLVVPVAFFMFYTAYSVFPILAAVEDLDASIYDSISIVVPRVVDEAEGPTRLGKDGGAKPLPVSTSLRSMTRLLYNSRRCFSFCRGYSWFFLFGIVKSLALGVCVKSPSWASWPRSCSRSPPPTSTLCGCTPSSPRRRGRRTPSRAAPWRRESSSGPRGRPWRCI
uniref:Uncharacterized protein n=1 Tax=Bionectria ochroleuca TaxID=29856 RepID=A0A8H7KCW9_BIOOC